MPSPHPSRGRCPCGRKGRYHFHGKGHLCPRCWDTAAGELPSPLEREVEAACNPSNWRKTALVEPVVDCGACHHCGGALVTQAGLGDEMETRCFNCGREALRPVAV